VTKIRRCHTLDARGLYEGMDDERDIVRGLRAGDAVAFEALYRRHRDAIWRFLARLAGDGPLAEDLFQETWLAAARRAHLVREDTAPLRWLYTIAHNKHRNLRRGGVMDGRKRDAFGWEATTAPGASDGAVLARLDVARVGAAMARLPEAFREVLALCACEGLSAEDAAAVLEISPEAVRKRLSRARAALAALLDPRTRGGEETT
jgi:RNA polymerase sigma factor (sigma-70 family)